MKLEHGILFSSMYPEVVRSQAPDVALSEPSQSWRRKGAGVSDAVQRNKPGVAASCPGGMQAELRAFHSLLGLELAVLNLTECLIA